MRESCLLKQIRMIVTLLLIAMLALSNFQTRIKNNYSRFDNRVSITGEREKQDFTVNNPILLYICYDIFVEGTLAYFVGQFGLKIFNVSNPNSPDMVNLYSGNRVDFRGIFVNGNLAFVPSNDYYEGALLQILYCGDPTSLAVIGECQIEGGNNGGIFVEGRYVYLLTEEYGLSGPKGSLAIIDWSNSAKPIEVGRYSGQENWTYEDIFVKDRFVYLLKESFSREENDALEIIDATNASDPHKVGEWVDTERIYGIFVEDNFAFIATRQGLEIIDVSNPRNLQKVAEFSDAHLVWDVFVSGSNAYILKHKELLIFDISDMGELTKKGSFYHNEDHGSFFEVFIEDDFAYLIKTSEYSDRMLFIVNCSNPAEPKKLFPASLPSSAPKWPTLLTIFLAIIAMLSLIFVIIYVASITSKRRKKEREDKDEDKLLNINEKEM